MNSKAIAACMTIVGIFMIGCGTSQSDPSTEPSQIAFCDIVKSPNEFLNRSVETKSLIIGYHRFFAYDKRCNRPENVVELVISFDQRRQITNLLGENRSTYDETYFNNNVYAEITMTGRLVKNEADNSNLGLVTPVYSFAVSEILSVESPTVAIAPEYR